LSIAWPADQEVYYWRNPSGSKFWHSDIARVGETAENDLNREQLKQLNRILDMQIEAEPSFEGNTHRFSNLLDWGKSYRDIVDNTNALPYLEPILGIDFRLDHVYLDVIRSGLGPIGATLHGGSTPFNPSMYYHFRDGRMYNGLIVVAYNLKDVGPKDGGLGCITGSHKSNFPFPGEWKDMSEELHPSVRTVIGSAGSAVIFTEALTHGSLPWRGKSERRTLFYKYSPHPISWSATYINGAKYADLTDRQSDILEAPNARCHYRPR
jgi:hypothetical protein